MSAKGPSSGTSFENMSHEQMLAWLDQAHSGQVHAAAERLVAAAKVIREIADELKIRPQWVAWKGDGANAFRTWTADLANSTLRLGDFSEDAAKWLTEASGAIAQAQASIPRDTGSAQANLEATRASHNDPDAAGVASRSERELAALAAHKEEVRQQAAAQMRKLAQTYMWSAMQMNALERPKFPPPPDALRPPRDAGSEDLSRPGPAGSPGLGEGSSTSSGISATGAGVPGVHVSPRSAHGQVADVSMPSPKEHTAPDTTAPDTVPAPRMDIDSVATLPPQIPHAPTDAVSGPPFPDQVRRETPSQPGLAPPAFGNTGNNRSPASMQGPRKAVADTSGPVRAVTGSPQQGATTTGPISPTGPGQAAATGRAPLLPGQGLPPVNSGRMPSGPANGLIGGNPVMPPASRSQGAIPRGVVIGGESTRAHGPVRRTTGIARSTGHMISQPGGGPGRRPPSPTSGIVGGLPLSGQDIPGAAPQRPGRPTDRTPGAVAPGAVVSPDAARGGPASPANNMNRRGRPRLAAENESPRHQDGRRAVPPVID